MHINLIVLPPWETINVIQCAGRPRFRTTIRHTNGIGLLPQHHQCPEEISEDLIKLTLDGNFTNLLKLKLSFGGHGKKT